MNPKTKIKVNKADLIAAIQDRKAEAQADYEKAVADYKESKATWDDRIADHLEKLAAKARAGKLLKKNGRDYFDRYDLVRDVPDYPREPVKPTAYDRSLAQLKMSVDETISLSVEDYAAYIR